MRLSASCISGRRSESLLRRGGLPLILLLGTALTGCAMEEIVHGLNEKEANQIVELLADNDVSASKIMNATGRETVYNIAVPGSARTKAIKILNKNEMPRRRDKGYSEVFESSGLIPTSGEEKAKKLAALEGEIERQLKLIEGLLDVQVQVVMPEESALRTTKEQEAVTTASVTVKYLAGAGGARPVSEPEIQAIVSAGVEKLHPENVVVLMRQAGPPPAAAAAANPNLTGLMALGNNKLYAGLVALLVVIALLGTGLMATQIRLKTVRGRFIRLQTEIAKARRKPGEGTSPGAAQQLAP